jgi:uncharacterized integral membrane protein
MSTLWLKIKLWTKVAILAVLAIYALVFVVKNTGKTVELWLWYNTVLSQPLLLYTVIMFLVGVLAAMLAKTLWTTLKQFRELRRLGAERRRAESLADLEAKAAMLQTREAAVANAAPGRSTSAAPAAPSPTTSTPADLSGGGNVVKE